MIDYLRSATSGDNAAVAFIFASASWLLFPDATFVTAFVVVFIAAGLDVLTKYVALSKRHGGIVSAIRAGELTSDRMWRGMSVKIYAYLIVAILVGLAYRVVYIRDAGLFAGSFVYSMLFLREAQSIIENLTDAGADLGWLGAWVRKKQRDLMDGVEEERKSDDETPTI